MKTRSFLMALVFASLPATVLAASKGGVQMPDKVTVAGTSLVLNGLGIRQATVFNINVYVAGLYLESKSADGNAIAASAQKKRLELRFVRSVDRDDLVGAFEDGFKKNGGAAMKDGLAKLNSFVGDVKEGDVMIMAFVPGEGVTVIFKGKRMGVIPGDDFARVLFSIWLGANPPNQSLREGLLGK